MSAHNDAAFLRMFLWVLGGLVAFTVIIVFLARMVSGPLEEIRSSDSLRQAMITKRIAPVGNVNIAGTQQAVATPAPAAARSGGEVYQAVCMACHMTGAAGAPKIGDKAAWEPRLGVGMDQLTASVINGKGAMPPRAGNPATTDEEIRAAVAHILEETGVEAAGGNAATTPTGAVEQVKEAASAAVGQAKTAALGVVATGQEMVVGAADKVKETVASATNTTSEPATGGPVDVDLVKGKGIYQMACFACHGTGAAGAPKLGDKSAWAPRIAQGSEVLLKNAINGKGAMPPKGGRTDLGDSDVMAAIAYILTESQ